MICDRLLSHQLRANTIRSYLIPSPIRFLSVKQAASPNTMIIEQPLELSRQFSFHRRTRLPEYPESNESAYLSACYLLLPGVVLFSPLEATLFRHIRVPRLGCDRESLSTAFSTAASQH